MTSEAEAIQARGSSIVPVQGGLAPGCLGSRRRPDGGVRLRAEKARGGGG